MEENSSQSNKYDAALAKYNTNLSDADIQARVADLIEKKVPENNTEEVKKLLFNCIDLTTLNSTDSDEPDTFFCQKNRCYLQLLHQGYHAPEAGYMC